MSMFCDFVYLDNYVLRINVFWVLKYFVDVVGLDLKKKCFEELGVGWLL